MTSNRKEKWRLSDWIPGMAIAAGSIISNEMHDGSGPYCLVVGFVALALGMFIGVRMTLDRLIENE